MTTPSRPMPGQPEFSDNNQKGAPIFGDDPFGSIKKEKGDPNPPSKIVGQFHTNADTDSSINAKHHTLGIKRNQASPGDHTHNGISSRKIGTESNLSVSGSRGGNAALQSLLSMLADVIDFDDNTTP